MRKLLCVFAVVGCLSVTAFSQPLPEVEPNDTFGTAQILPADFFDDFGAGAIEGFLAADDVDFYMYPLSAGTFATASVFDFTPGAPFDNDSVLGVFSPDGTLFDSDDDGGPGFMSAIAWVADVSGLWAVAVSGFGDIPDFDGGHNEEFDYQLVLSIPEPASLGLLLVGLGFLIRRR